ncbi:Bacterio-opsin activator HTH domain-containing protein [Natrinema pellirubrum DSM 15624]|uniref:Bacterio-opsin activator HTH domain-containing protein n=1 Tax=Natrinema pellirubrum (strain DSM 15624 / CIP 106293 / JCM 10476 / NCIMB 786 / 157) TaxID=797303 RepID=L9Z6G4_NATP1|nr:Bacterio-opsin activator HTH domain-containing protein [Natrinema pellirubrum DSM 15624]
MTDIADRLNVSKATCSDVLHRAEGSIVSWFVDEQFGTASDPRSYLER